VPAGNAFVLAAGAHTFSAQVRDPSGNLSVRTPPIAFTVAGAPPVHEEPVPVVTPAPVPAPPTPPAPAKLRVAVKAAGKGTHLRAITLRGVPLDAGVTVTCSCSKRRVSKRGVTRITTFRRLPLHAVLTVTVSAPGSLPAVATVTARRGRAPRVVLR
jgi:hypothetical protein